MVALFIMVLIVGWLAGKHDVKVNATVSVGDEGVKIATVRPDENGDAIYVDTNDAPGEGSTQDF
jgi:hypothetical protein